MALQLGPSELSGLQRTLPGVKPSLQKRSRKTTAALLAAGAELLRQRTLSELSIEELCATVGATVGAFYSRFESKDAYFHALQVVAADRGAARFRQLASDADAQPDLGGFCRSIATMVVAWFAENEGVVRASLQHDSTHPERWGVFKQLGRDLAEGSAKHLLAAMEPGRRAAKLRAVGFAYQVMFGTLVNAVLNDPGPCRLGDPDMADRMARLFETILAQE